MALIESYGIAVVVTDEGEYAGSPGFATAGRRAIVATWIGADGIWHVDVTDRWATLHEFRDTARQAVAHSVIAVGHAAGRLAALADYLGIDWTWLRRRSAECAEQGLADLARPRSRHLSTAGVDRALPLHRHSRIEIQLVCKRRSHADRGAVVSQPPRVVVLGLGGTIAMTSSDGQGVTPTMSAGDVLQPGPCPFSVPPMSWARSINPSALSSARGVQPQGPGKVAV